MQDNDVLLKERYNKKNIHKIYVLILAVILLCFFMLLFTGVGTADITFRKVVDSICAVLKGTLDEGNDAADKKIIVLLRLPRIILAVLSGFGLAISGTTMQAITKNPMVSPFTVGISSAAAFGASLSIVFGLGFLPGTEIGTVSTAFFFSILCAVVVYSISYKLGMSPESIILTGIAINYLFSAFSSTIQFYADEHQLSAAVQWSFGTMNGAEWPHVIIICIVVGISLLFFMRNAWLLNALSMGSDELVIGLGINPQIIRGITGLISVLVTSAIISFTGVIGFIGLVAPHIARMIVGSDHRFLIPYAGIVGGGLLLFSDTIGRVILSPVIIPVGIVVSYLGVPLFIYLIVTRKEYV